MQCAHCGAEIRRTDRFCSSCGEKLVSSYVTEGPEKVVEIPHLTGSSIPEQPVRARRKKNENN